MPNYSVEAIVLRRIPLGETDKIVTLLCRQQGKVRAVAKGARRPGGRFTGATEILTHARLQLAEGRNLEVVTQCEILTSCAGIRGDYQRTMAGAYLCELVDKMTEDEEPCPELFDLLLSAFGILAQSSIQPARLLSAFELRLLEERGYRVALMECARCGGELEGEYIAFGAESGGSLCVQCRGREPGAVPISIASLGVLRELAAGTLEQASASNLDPQAFTRASRTLREVLCHHVHGKIRSLDFLEVEDV